MKPSSMLVVAVCAAVGILAGILVANGWFKDPDVELGARVIFGVIGLVIGVTLSRFFVTRHADSY